MNRTKRIEAIRKNASALGIGFGGICGRAEKIRALLQEAVKTELLAA